jgi:hypothetical protein
MAVAMTTTFAVDDVVPAAEPALTIALRELVGEHAWLGGDPELRVLDERKIHPLLGAVHYAFAEHRPLVLSPDAVWLTIAQGVAQHVRLNTEALRPRLVRHTGKRTLEVERETPPDSAADWADIVSEFRAAVAGAIGAGRARLLTCDFSTTTEVERVASEIVLLDAMSPYFDFRLVTICGIPRITLTGTPADWRSIRARVDVLAELDLASWCASLAPIADRLAAAADGRADVEFFRRIYKPREAYGWDRITGWIARLYPYLRSALGDYTRPNPLLELPLDHELAVDDGLRTLDSDYFNGPGSRTFDPPAGPSRVVVRVKARGGPERLLTIEGGLLAIEQDGEGRLVPRAGYVVRDGGDVAVLIERLGARGASAAEPGDGDAWSDDAQLHALFAAIGTVQLGAWRLVPASERVSIRLAEKRFGTLAAARVIDLNDGTFLAVSETRRVVRLEAAQLAPLEARPFCLDEPACSLATRQRLDQIPVVAPSLIELLSRALSGDSALVPLRLLVDIDPELWDGKSHAAPLVERLARDHEVIPGDRLFGLIDTLAMRVGDATWRTFAPPPAWGRPWGRIEVGDGRINPLIDLGDGRVLAQRIAPRSQPILVLELAAITATRVGKRNVTELVSAQPPERIPIVGRSLVDVLTYALDHGRLPGAVHTLADTVVDVNE